MPELPEVETTKTSLSPILGQRVSKIQVFQPKLRWQMPDDLCELVDYTLQSIERRAKYLILNFAPTTTAIKEQRATTTQDLVLQSRQLIMHLGMSGSLQQYPVDTEKRKHDHLIITFDDYAGKQTQLHYHDPRRFGAVLWYKDYSAKLLDHLGPEPLSVDFDVDYLYHLIQRTAVTNTLSIDTVPNDIDLLTSSEKAKKSSIKKAIKRPITRAIKSVIMEQQVVVGVGNIYATESLYLSAIHPATPAYELTYEQIVTLVAHIKTILRKAIELGGSTLRDFTVASGQTGYFQQTLNVYGKQGEPCPQCTTKLENIKINGRASVYCPNCQTI